MVSSKRISTRLFLLAGLLAGVTACGGGSSESAEGTDARAGIYQHGPELVHNGSFTNGLKRWETYFEGTGSAEIKVNGAGAALIRVISSDANPWGIQLHTHGLSMVANRTYRLTFRARASAPTSFAAVVREHNADVDGDGFPWTDILTFPVNAGTAWTQYTFDFTMPYTDPDTGILFNLGRAAPGKIFIDDVSVVESLAPPRGTKLVGNGDFAAGLQDWQTWLQDGGVATFGITDGAATVKVTTAAKDNWGVQLHRGGIPLFAGHRYKLAFTAWAKKPLPLRALVQENGHDINGDGFAYTAYRDDTYTLGTTPKRYVAQFEVPFTNVDAGVFFFFGDATGKYFVDDVTVVEVAPLAPVYPAVGAVDGSEDEAVFRPGQVLTYDVTMTQADWDYVEAHGVGEEWMPATVTVSGDGGAPVELGQVGFRHKGGYGTLDSCWGPPTLDEDGNPDVLTHNEMLSRERLDESWCRKISYKFKFNNYVKGTRFHGLKKLNLHSESRDSTLLHDMLAYSTFYDFGVDAPRTAPARLFINGQFQGLFIAVEDVDDRYAVYHYPGAAGGDLFKEVWPNPDAQERMGDESFTDYVSAGQEEGDDPSDFLALTGGVATAVAQGSTDPIASMVDLDGLMRYMAVDRAISNWDGITALYTCSAPGCQHVGPHNYYWYRDTSDQGRFHLVPWDMDNTFAPCDPFVESCGYGADRPIPNWNVKPNDCSPIGVWGNSWVVPSGCDDFLNLLAANEWARFETAGRALVTGPLTTEALQAKALAWSRLIEPIVEEDPVLNANAWRRDRDTFIKSVLPRVAGKLTNLLDQGYVVQPPPPKPGENLIFNGTFDKGLYGWRTYTQDGAAATFLTPNGEGEVSVLAPALFYSVQFSYNGLSLEEGKHYRLSFRARADSARTIRTSVWENGHDLNADGSAYGSYEFDDHVIGTDMATYTSGEFVMPLTNPDAGVVFFLGENAGQVVIDDVSLVEVL